MPCTVHASAIPKGFFLGAAPVKHRVVTGTPDTGPATGTAPSRPPAWLLVATGALAVSCLVLAIAETNLWAHYLIDGGERLSWLALAFILIVGLGLFRRRGLFVSLPLVCSWLLYQVITKGDQIIDHLSINAMRIVCHALWAAIFAAPVAVVVLAARYAFGPKPGRPPIVGGWRAYIPGLRRLSEGQTRKGMAIMAAVLFAGEVLVAYQFLGTLMVGTLLLLMCGALACVPRRPFESLVKVAAEPERRERFALVVLLLGVAASLALHIGC